MSMPGVSPEREAKSLKLKIFIAAFVTQFCMGYEVLLRLNGASAIKQDFFDSTNGLTSGAMIGEVMGALFLGFAIGNFLMSPFVDAIGSRKLHVISVLTYIAGTAVVITAVPGQEHAYLALWAGSLLQGLAWGSIEAVLNPLIVTIYPKDRVLKLNLFHSAYALGMLIGAPTCVMVAHFELGWRIQLAFVMVPALTALLLIARVKYPVSERVASGVSFKGMFTNTFGKPAFYLFLAAMFLTSATELVPGSWIDLTLTKVVGIQGFWLVAFIYTVQIVVRLFTGVLNRLIGSSGILLFGSIFAMGGLFLLSQATNPISGLTAALLFGIGTSVMWPTMLASTSERFSKGGSLAIGVTASAGMVSTYVCMPLFGMLYDQSKIEHAGGPAAFEALKQGSEALDQVLVAATTSVFESAALLPCALIVFFSLAWIYDSKRRRSTTKSQSVVLEH